MGILRINYNDMILPIEQATKIFELFTQQPVEQMDGNGDSLTIKQTTYEIRLSILQPAQYALGKMNSTLSMGS